MDEKNDFGIDKVRYFAEFRIIPQIIECDPGYALSWLLNKREKAAGGLYKEAFEEVTEGAYPFSEKDFSVEVYSRSSCRNDAVIIMTYPENTESEMICLKGCAVFLKNEDNEWVSRYITVETDTYNGNNGKFCFIGEFRGDNHINLGFVPKGKNNLIEKIEEIVFGSKSRSKKLVKVK
ncbi:MAG: hypothetical protein LUG66_02170 [Clostridiales bacterium]|nr:hypothetical protein [Clostridiales bacterium]